MCFSASASFVASSVLVAGGIASVRHVHSRSQIPFAIIPFLFSAQQFCEGLLWLALTHPDFAGWQKAATYSFLVFAQILWPFWVPLSVLVFETNKRRRKLLKVFLFVGIGISGVLAYCVLVYPIRASVSSLHIHYDLDFPLALSFTASLYLLTTVIAPLFSSALRIRAIGVAILISFLVTKIFYGEYVISVWCFFAAVISMFVFLVMKDANKPLFQHHQHDYPNLAKE